MRMKTAGRIQWPYRLTAAVTREWRVSRSPAMHQTAMQTAKTASVTTAWAVPVAAKKGV